MTTGTSTQYHEPTGHGLPRMGVGTSHHTQIYTYTQIYIHTQIYTYTQIPDLQLRTLSSARALL